MTTAVVIIGLVTVGYVVVVVGLFERLAPRPWVRAYQRAANPLFRLWAGRTHGLSGDRDDRTPVRAPLVTPQSEDAWTAAAYWLVTGDASQSDPPTVPTST